MTDTAIQPTTEPPAPDTTTALNEAMLLSLNEELRRVNGDLNERLTSLRSEVEALSATCNTLRQSLATAHGNHASDIRIIGEELNQQANDRDWCEDFDHAVERINGRLNVALPDRTVEREFTIRGVLHVPFRTSYTAEVRLSDSQSDREDAALTQWRESNQGYRDVDYSLVDAEFSDSDFEVDED